MRIPLSVFTAYSLGLPGLGFQGLRLHGFCKVENLIYKAFLNPEALK